MKGRIATPLIAVRKLLYRAGFFIGTSRKARVRSVTAACQFPEEVGGSKRSSRAATVDEIFVLRVPQEGTGRVPALGTSFS